MLGVARLLDLPRIEELDEIRKREIAGRDGAARNSVRKRGTQMSESGIGRPESGAAHETGAAGSGESRHQWYDEDFCPGGGRFVGLASPQVACPVCGEMMDVDEHGDLFKHRPHIPKSAG
jgi:hypothetical protein